MTKRLDDKIGRTIQWAMRGTHFKWWKRIWIFVWVSGSGPVSVTQSTVCQAQTHLTVLWVGQIETAQLLWIQLQLWNRFPLALREGKQLGMKTDSPGGTASQAWQAQDTVLCFNSPFGERIFINTWVLLKKKTLNSRKVRWLLKWRGIIKSLVALLSF